MRAPTAIDIRNLSLTFQTGDGPVYALADANLTIAKGEFVSFIGPSGCGKTCLLYTSPSPRDVEESRMPSSA